MPLITSLLLLCHPADMKNTQAPIRKYPIDNMEIVSVQVPPEQLINVLQTTLTPNLKITTCQQLIKILARISMP